jgi:hypothetical protein
MKPNVCTRRHFPKEDCRTTAHLVQVSSVFEKTANFAVELLTDCGRKRIRYNLDAEPEILNLVEENPGSSIRRWAYRVGVSPYTVWRTLKEQGLHPYHIQLVQGLKPEDLLKRVRFCEWLLEKNEEPQFIERLLTTDETTFTSDGIFNARNTHLGPNS